MVLIAQYDESQVVTGFSSDGTSYPLSYKDELISLGHTIEYKAQALLDDELLTKAKLDAENRVKDGINNDFENGTYLSTVAGITIDNRRYGAKNDIANLQGCIDLNVYPFTWIGTDGAFDIVDSIVAVELKAEMTQNGLDRYTKKWLKEQDILACVTVADFDSVVW